MPTHLYCLLPANSAVPPGLAGLDGAAVRALHGGALDAWVSDASAPPAGEEGAPLVERLRAHDVVVAAALDAGVTPLPARFGQRFRDDADCLRDLAHRARELAAQLERVRGQVEMTLTGRLRGAEARASEPGAGPPDAAAPTGSPAVGGSGRAYLERVKAALRVEQEMQLRIAAVRRRVTETVGALVRDEVVQVRPSPTVTLSISHLVPRGSLDAYRQAAAGLRDDPALPPLVILGPLAPWRFAEVARA